MDILSCPGALLTLNDLTMLLKTMTVSGCNKMDSERERHKKSLREEFVGKILLDKFDVMLVKLSQKSLAMSTGLVIFTPVLEKLAGYGALTFCLLITSLRIFKVCFKLDLAMSNFLS